MNHERMLAVADAVERDPEHFSMSDWMCLRKEIGKLYGLTSVNIASIVESKHVPCDTAACLAGHAVVMYAEDDSISVHRKDEVHRAAQNILGLNDDEAEHLFFWMGAHSDRRDVTAAEAAAKMRRMVAASLAGRPTVPEYM